VAKKKGKKPTCGYCKVFHSSTDRNINETDDKEKFSRHCNIINDRVVSGAYICEYFILNKYFLQS
jgi:hypothetical protein